MGKTLRNYSLLDLPIVVIYNIIKWRLYF